MRIGHWQVACIPGDVRANLTTVIEGLRQADTQGIEIVSFPESLLTGYYRERERAWNNSLQFDGPEIRTLLCDTAWFKGTFMVGFNERRGDLLCNTVLVARQGEMLGTYSKAFPCFNYFEPGRDFPLFEHDGLCFGVVICADGGYIEPTRILAVKGARVVFAPHYNYIAAEHLLGHFMQVRSDHTARARENQVWFLRGNNVVFGRDEGLGYDGVGYGDSYLVDPQGEIVVRSQRQVEQLIAADVSIDETSDYRRHNLASARALLPHLREAVRQASAGSSDS